MSEVDLRLSKESYEFYRIQLLKRIARLEELKAPEHKIEELRKKVARAEELVAAIETELNTNENQ
ncbi:MAG: hypothetical protein D4R67_12035 [Bacteroidetes bacterium]|nr:MAG: hypothetical protein D4R67_12035 [Bacteroidota bacterium]